MIISKTGTTMMNSKAIHEVTRSTNTKQKFLLARLITININGTTTCSRYLSTSSRHHNVIQSPFPQIPPGPYSPISDFVSENWHQFGSKVAIVDGTTDQSRTFQDYDISMRSIGASLRHRLGIGPGDIVLLFSPNHVDYLPMILGIGMTGATVSPINPLSTPMELRKMIQKTRPKVILAHERVLEVAIQAISLESESNSCDSTVEHIVCIPHLDEYKSTMANTNTSKTKILHLNDLKHYSSPLQASSTATASADNFSQNLDVNPFILPFSSGTTGLPKGISLSHSNLVANLLQTHVIEGASFYSHHSLISPLPFYHIYGLVVSLLYTARNGQTLITSSGRFDLKDFCHLVERHKPTRAHLVPPIILGLVKTPIQHDMSSLKTIISAAASLPADLEEQVSQKIRSCKVKQGWGMSELSPLGTLSSDDYHKAGSVGRLVSSTLGKIIDLENGENLGPGEIGELAIKVSYDTVYHEALMWKTQYASLLECLLTSFFICYSGNVFERVHR